MLANYPNNFSTSLQATYAILHQLLLNSFWYLLFKKLFLHNRQMKQIKHKETLHWAKKVGVVIKQQRKATFYASFLTSFSLATYHVYNYVMLNTGMVIELWFLVLRNAMHLHLQLE